MGRLIRPNCSNCLKAAFKGSVHCDRCGKRLYFLPLAFTGICLIALGFGLLPLVTNKPDSILPEVQPEVKGQANWLRDRQSGRLAGKKDNHIDQLMRQARTRKDLFKVVDELNRLLEQYPDYPYAMRLKGHLLMQCLAYKRAVKAFQAYLERVPEDYNTRVSLGIAYMNLKQFDQAMSTFEPVAKAYPNYPKLLKQLALASRAMGLSDQAKNYLARSEQVNKTGTAEKPPLIFHPKNPRPTGAKELKGST